MDTHSTYVDLFTQDFRTHHLPLVLEKHIWKFEDIATASIQD